MSDRQSQSTVALDGKRSLLIFRPQACSDKALLERMLYEREQLADLLVDRIRDACSRARFTSNLSMAREGRARLTCSRSSSIGSQATRSWQCGGWAIRTPPTG